MGEPGVNAVVAREVDGAARGNDLIADASDQLVAVGLFLRRGPREFARFFSRETETALESAVAVVHRYWLLTYYKGIVTVF